MKEKHKRNQMQNVLLEGVFNLLKFGNYEISLDLNKYVLSNVERMFLLIIMTNTATFITYVFSYNCMYIYMSVLGLSLYIYI